MVDSVTAGSGAAESASGPSDTALVAGIVKWYDGEKGYGFVVPDDGGPDVFLGKIVVLMAGLGEPAEGCRVKVAVQTRAKGRSATSLISVEAPAEAPPRRGRFVAPVGRFGPRRGLVKRFDDARGYGFITIGDGTADIFFHITAPGLELRRPADGDEVEVVWGNGPNGLIAAEVVPVGAAEMLRSA